VNYDLRSAKRSLGQTGRFKHTPDASATENEPLSSLAFPCIQSHARN
jgi:hypothetical protein